MPKRVNHHQRKEQIAKTVFQIILKDGIEGATVRHIAKEAELSLGALRYYFQTHEELLLFTMKMVKETVMKRVYDLMAQRMPPIDKAIALLLEFVPTNDQFKAEMEVWFAFTAYARHKPGFDPHDDHIYWIIHQLINHLDDAQFLKDNIDKKLEVEKLYALTNGLALHVLQEPERLKADYARRVIQSQIEGICRGFTV